ncbi:hypothetical protein PA7_36310 [Pseudonocardia asaccharolytica DSM 44247 = NBRC 16224]|uniref:Uncharacterized protein n=1 Tax=Pseudonocardia asaccharolytica DSM 44247 = NBRC 16224 TaxID=1123024 RepID=A0A511D828_9PSEU|nr:hypothetical protein PA7_36310 [Pseudonocardia asaccharolytica DSM 44247 = NBRC 16224]
MIRIPTNADRAASDSLPSTRNSYRLVAIGSHLCRTPVDRRRRIGPPDTVRAGTGTGIARPG